MQAERLDERRLFFLFIAFPAFFVLLFTRLGYVQFFHPRHLGPAAERQYQLIVKLPPYRGKILDRNGSELALDIPLQSLGVHSKDVKDKENLSRELARILGFDTGFVRERLRRPKSFVWIARLMPPEKTAQILALKEKRKKTGQDDLELRGEWKRIYPNRTVASHVIGFTGLDHEGLEGIEHHFDSFLKGVPGWKVTEKDAKRRELVSKQSDGVAPVDGANIRLTIDTVIQHMADKLLAETCVKTRALGGAVVVIDPATGDILALANFPQFDPNQLRSLKPGGARNRAITDIYEPGSAFKIITLSAVLENGAASLDDVFYCENGAYKTGGRVLHDVHPYGRLTLEDVIAKSSNIGTVKAAQRIGPQKLHEMIRKFGFGEKTDIPLPGECAGLLTNPRNWSATSASSVPIGQEVGLTALQLGFATAAIANNGLLMKPRLVSRIEDPAGLSVRDFPPVTRRRVISERTAREVRRAMVKVVTEGTGKLAAVEGSTVGGKTGTSQKLDAAGRYSHSNFIASFIGFVEKEGRTAAIAVSIDDPKPVYYGGVVAAPLFAKIARGLLEYWQLGAPADAGKALRPGAARR